MFLDFIYHAFSLGTMAPFLLSYKHSVNQVETLKTQNKQKKRKGKERKGKERKGKERKGKERKGRERKGGGGKKKKLAPHMCSCRCSESTAQVRRIYYV
jgi:hypothetical protein